MSFAGRLNWTELPQHFAAELREGSIPMRAKDSGWSGSGQADAAAKAGEKGGAYSGAAEVAPGVWAYQITKNGLALQLTLQGPKYYKDDDLNKTAKS